jgi:hypothetical protein
MPRHLRIVPISGEHDQFSAVEYCSVSFIPQEAGLVRESVRWESPVFPAAALIDSLHSRGWHQTDIGDALREARKQLDPAAG